MSGVKSFFEEVLVSENYRVIQLDHPWLKVFAQNFDGHGALLVRVKLPDDTVVGDARGFSVATSRKDDDHYLRITAEGNGLPELFLMLVDFVMDRTSSVANKSESINELSNAISEFKRFVSRKPGRLSREQAQGLYAEIQVLVRLIEAGISAENVLISWKGPFSKEGRGLHDFTFPNGRGLEVKSSHQPATEVRISSANQLLPDDQPLDLLVLPVETVPHKYAGSLSLKEIVSICTSLLGDAPAVLALWEEALEKFGTDFSDEYYEQWRFVPGPWKRYRVGKGFPSIAAEQIPRAVVRITYSLVLGDLAEFEDSADGLFEELVRDLDV